MQMIWLFILLAPLFLTSQLQAFRNIYRSLADRIEQWCARSRDIDEMVRKLDRALTIWTRTGNTTALNSAATLIYDLIDMDLSPVYIDKLNHISEDYLKTNRAHWGKQHHDTYIALRWQAVKITSKYAVRGSGRHVLYLFALGNALWMRYCEFQDPLDLEAARHYLSLSIKKVSNPERFDLGFQRDARGKLQQALRAVPSMSTNSPALEANLEDVQRLLLLSASNFTRDQTLQLKECLAALLLQRYHLAEDPDFADLESAVHVAREVEREMPEDFQRLLMLITILNGLYLFSRDHDIFVEAMNVLHRIKRLQKTHANSMGLAEHFQGVFHLIKFASSRAERDLQTAVTMIREAYAFAPEKNKDLLSRALYVRSQSRFSHPTDLREAYNMINDARSITTHMSLTESVNTKSLYAAILAAMSDVTENETHLREAIVVLKSICDGTDTTSTLWPQRMWKLGRVYGKAEDFKKAHECLQQASGSMDDRSFEYARCYRDLGDIYVSMTHASSTPGQTSAENDHLRLAAQAFVRALDSKPGETFVRVRSGGHAGLICYARGEWKESYEILKRTIELLPYLITRQLSMLDQQGELRGLSHISSIAASAALKINKSPLEGLMILESGRGMIVNQMLNLREEYADLKESHPDLHREYSTLQKALLASYPASHGLEDTHVNTGIQSSTERANKVNHIESLTKQIQSLPGFRSFPQSLDRVDIERLASVGSIVVFSIPYAENNLEPLQAFLVKAGKPLNVSVIQLPLSGSEATEMAERLTGIDRLSLKENRKRALANEELRGILEKLWNSVVRQILEELGLLSHPHSGNSKSRPRIWWITSGVMSMLPLHAAGIYDSNGKSTAACDEPGNSEMHTSRYVVSSYASTIRALVAAEKQKQRQKQYRRKQSTTLLELLLVAMPKSLGLRDLPDSHAEIKQISASVCPGALEGGEGCSAGIINDTIFQPVLYVNAKKNVVIQSLQNCTIAHFACHGTSNAVTPSHSGLHLGTATEPSLLSVEELCDLSLHEPQLAYLSACSTAQNGDHGLVNEILHVASSFQLAGFPQVIGNLWEVRDLVAKDMATDFYIRLQQKLAEASGELGDSMIVDTIHETIQARRVSKEGYDFLGWTSLVHFGY